MAYDSALVERIRNVLLGTSGLSEQKMFGGVCFSVNGYMACGVQEHDLVVRVGPDNHESALTQKYTRPMDFTGKPMAGYIYVSEAGCRRKADLGRWVLQGVRFVQSLPPKTLRPKVRKAKSVR